MIDAIRRNPRSLVRAQVGEPRNSRGYAERRSPFVVSDAERPVRRAHRLLAEDLRSLQSQEANGVGSTGAIGPPGPKAESAANSGLLSKAQWGSTESHGAERARRTR